MSVALSADSAADLTDPGPVPAIAGLVADWVILDERERGHFGARLHDGPLQDLLATRYLVDIALSAAAKGADAGSLAARLQAIRDAASAAVLSGRALLGDLTARCLDGRDLAGACAATGMTVSVDPSAERELSQLHPASAVVAHRLVRAVAAANDPVGLAGVPVSVSLARTATSLTVTFDPAPALGAASVAAWVDRARMLGATVRVCAGPVVVIDFPASPAPEGP